MRIAVLSDVHANLDALDAVLAAAGFVDAVWHLGDIVGYGPDPDQVVDRLAGLGAVGVMGNHDAAATVDPDLAEWFNPEAKAAIEWTRTRIEPATVAWLAALPQRHREGDWSLVHGSLREPLWEYITTEAEAKANLEALETPFGLFGHTHVPLALRLSDGRIEPLEPRHGDTVDLGDGPLLLNPGSVGQPRDGDPAASWLILDTDAATATWGRATYDVAAVQARMREARLPRRLAERLEHGW